MKIIFENELGRAVFYGGSGKGFNILALEGLSLTDRSYTSVRYRSAAGKTTVDEVIGSRIITIAGDILKKYEPLTENAVNVLSKETTLTVIKKGKKRQAKAKTLSFEIYSKNKNYLSYTLQVECGSPYFSDENPVDENVYSRENTVKNSITLPCIFTVRKTSKSVECKSFVNIFPVITITDNGARTNEDPKDRLVIKNNTTGKQVCLLYSTVSGDEISIDFDKREIKSTVNGNIAAKLDESSFLSDFYLVNGMNSIEVVNETARDICVKASYFNLYNECI